MFVTSREHGVLIEGVRPGADPVRARITPTDAVDVLDALWGGRAIDLPAVEGATGIRRLQFRPRPDGVEISIRSHESIASSIVWLEISPSRASKKNGGCR